LIDKHSNGNVSVFAIKTGIKQATLHNYTKGRKLHIESLYNICNNLGVNINWLLTGEGDPYIKVGECDTCIYKVENIPEVKIAEGGVPFTAITDEDDAGMDDLLNMTRAIIKSGTGYSHSLAANIRSFYQAMQTEQCLSDFNDRLCRLEEERELSREKESMVRETDDKALRGEILKKRRA
jgi:transcriptional regulator with XRE-family HTH domain